jgi:hypothetical protein
MKKFILFFLLFAAVTAASAYEENYWPRFYFVRAGMGITATTGDLNERPISVKDTNDKKFKAYPPDMSLMGDPEFVLGVNIREFTVAVAFQYWEQEEELVKLSTEESTRFWRLGFEFYYNFFWPDYFQVGLGAGFSYTSVKTENSAIYRGEPQDTEFMGSGVGLMANVQYYFTNEIAIIPAVKFYRNWFKNVYTDDSENQELDPFLWQTFVSASISLQLQF